MQQYISWQNKSAYDFKIKFGSKTAVHIFSILLHSLCSFQQTEHYIGLIVTQLLAILLTIFHW